MTKTIAITNQKGGVGKTTTAINLAYYLAKGGRTTLLIDFDPQGNATSGLGIDKEKVESSTSELIKNQVSIAEVSVKSKYKNLSIVPTTPHLANTEVELANSSHNKFTCLKNSLKDVEEFEYIIIDCPPSLNLLSVNGLVAADYVLLPVQAEFYALEGLGQLLETMKLVRKALNKKLALIGVLVTMMDKRTTLSQQVHKEIQKHFPDKIFKTVIPRNIRLAEAPSHGLPIGAYERWSKGARSYKSLAKEVVERSQKGEER